MKKQHQNLQLNALVHFYELSSFWNMQYLLDRSKKAILDLQNGLFSIFYAAQSLHKTAACSKTVSAAFSCLLGG